MPWKVQRVGDKYAVVKKSDGSTVATHPNAAAARNQVKALYAAKDKTDRKRTGVTPNYAVAARRRAKKYRDSMSNYENDDKAN